MATVRVHVTLDESHASSPEARASLLAALRSLGLTDVNEGRFERYGLLSGLVEESHLDQIRRHAGVRSVELDRSRSPR
jgi:hypothetical protein